MKLLEAVSEILDREQGPDDKTAVVEATAVSRGE